MANHLLTFPYDIHDNSIIIICLLLFWISTELNFCLLYWLIIIIIYIIILCFSSCILISFHIILIFFFNINFWNDFIFLSNLSSWKIIWYKFNFQYDDNHNVYQIFKSISGYPHIYVLSIVFSLTLILCVRSLLCSFIFKSNPISP